MIGLKKESEFLILLFLIIAIAAVPAYADNSTDNSTIYGVNQSQTTPAVTAPTTGRTYTITPYTRPCDSKVLKYTTYNKYTKNYYTLITYMKKFERSGGGTLILTKGTYYISNTVPIPSNVNLILNDGVVINKGTKTGTRKFSASTSIFQLVQPSKFKKSGAYSRYNGVKNVNIISRGNAVINLRYLYKNIAIVCGHNRNIQIQGITFRNLNCGHFIELDATNGIKITNCKFLSSKGSSKSNAEAINLDTPDRNTKGFNCVWTSYDKTPNNNVLIENNVFSGLDRAIGTHKYSQRMTNGKYVTNYGQVYHTGIVIRNNYIYNTRSDSIRILNWKNAQITNNYISTVPRNSLNYRGILATGVNLTIKYNQFVNMNRPVQILASKNTGNGYMYSATYNSLTRENVADIAYNLCVNVSEHFVRYSNRYNDYSNQIQIKMVT